MKPAAALRALPAVQGLVGAVLLARPDAATGVVLQPDTAAAVRAGDRRPPAAVVRVLGLRLVVQAIVIAAALRRRSAGGSAGDRDLRAALIGGAAVDAVHAASMVAVTAWKPPYRRSALASAGLAAVSAGAELASARSAHSAPTAPTAPAAAPAATPTAAPATPTAPATPPAPTGPAPEAATRPTHEVLG